MSMTIENANINIENAHLAKVAVVGSTPIARSIFLPGFGGGASGSEGAEGEVAVDFVDGAVAVDVEFHAGEGGG